MMGGFNQLYSIAGHAVGEDIVNLWSAQLYVDQALLFHGGCFEGNQVNILLKNVDILEMIGQNHGENRNLGAICCCSEVSRC